MLVTLSLSGKFLNAPEVISGSNREFQPNAPVFSGLRVDVNCEILMISRMRAVLDFFAVVS
jgi:hypothetical protein